MAKGKPIVATSLVDNGEKKVPSVLLEVHTVTKENMMDTVVADGMHTLEAVYRSIPEEERPTAKTPGE